ncbi:MAG: Hsp70 family protein [Phycisphaerales bacterium]|jgi:molecular chaperone DnaK (HSP70)|nr:Hsp70 family protein [Phycisphaerales bacterium]
MGGPIVGIDLGTTNSLIAFCDERGPRILTTPKTSGPDADPILPSVVRYEPDGSIVIGYAAKDAQHDFPDRTISSVKRLMGRSLDDVAADLSFLAYGVVRGAGDTARVRLPPSCGARVLSPQEVSAEILRALKRRAESALGAPVHRAVVTVPAYFDDAQRQATRDAGRLAGLDVVRIVAEPTAAALAYGIGTERSSARNLAPQHVAVFDLGGGTFDVSILRITPMESATDANDAETLGPAFYQVLATAGDTRLGGDDFDQALTTLFVQEIGTILGNDSLQANDLPPTTRRALVAFARDVKHRLSSEDRASVRIDLGKDRAYERTITRAELESLLAPMLDRAIACCARALRDAHPKLGGASIDRVVMVGGSTRIPIVRAKVAEMFHVEPYTALDPDQVVALGAAVQARVLHGAGPGAPAAGGASSLLLDVIPLSLGVETAGGAVAKLVLRNSPVPARALEHFSTSVDGQTSIKLNILQGEREMASDCRSLGEFHLRGIPPMPAGIPKLEVEFLVDANGVLHVSAIEQRSGRRASLQVVPNHGLTREEVDRIETESLTHAREDMQRHRVADLIVNARLDLKWIGERLKRFERELESAYATSLRTQIEGLRAMIERADTDWRSVDPDALYRAKQSLDEASVRLQEVSIAASLREDGRESAGRS